MRIVERADIPLSRRSDLTAGQVSLTWLGQAGFLVESQGVRFLIDPYLSDALAEKYRGSRFPHERMMQPPVSAESLRDIDYCFSTHGHTDHLDPGSLPAIARNNPDCSFVVPRSCRKLAHERGVPEEKLLGVSAGERKMVGAVELEAISSAHEERRQDEEGEELFLGYVFRLQSRTFYHSGDGIPYSGLIERLSEAKIELFLMPVNGRDELRRENGVPGNFTLQEAAAIAQKAGGEVLIGHHYGMFDFNTIDPAAAHKWIDSRAGGAKPRCLLAELGRDYLLE